MCDPESADPGTHTARIEAARATDFQAILNSMRAYLDYRASVVGDGMSTLARMTEPEATRIKQWAGALEQAMSTHFEVTEELVTLMQTLTEQHPDNSLVQQLSELKPGQIVFLS